MASSGATPRQRTPPLSDGEAIARHKQAAAQAAAELVENGLRVGLGTGSTVAFLLPALAERAVTDMRCVATSSATERIARDLGLTISTLEEVGELDLAIDGADQIDPQGWLVKGGGGAHTREKIVAAAAKRFVVIASAEKSVARLGPPVPLELVPFGHCSTLKALGQAALRAPDAARAPAPSMGGPEEPRTAHGPRTGPLQVSPDGGLIADYLGAVGDPRQLAARLGETPGVIEHGLFPPEMVSLILIAGDGGVEWRPGGKPDS